MSSVREGVDHLHGESSAERRVADCTFAVEHVRRLSCSTEGSARARAFNPDSSSTLVCRMNREYLIYDLDGTSSLNQWPSYGFVNLRVVMVSNCVSEIPRNCFCDSHVILRQTDLSQRPDL